MGNLFCDLRASQWTAKSEVYKQQYGFPELCLKAGFQIMQGKVGI